jgi:hypothetical protein
VGALDILACLTGGSLLAQPPFVAYPLAKENERFVTRMLRLPALTPEEAAVIYRPNPYSTAYERIAARTTKQSRLRLIKESKLRHEDL